MQHTGTCNITGFAHVPEAGAVCVSDASGRLLMIDTETRAIEEVRGSLHQDYRLSQRQHVTGRHCSPAARHADVKQGSQDSSGCMSQVGYLDGGVAALQWAPDGETLCIITSRGQMLLMTKVSGCFSL